MSQSPDVSAASPDEIKRYSRGWTAFTRMISAGRSFSGHERNCCFLNLGNGSFADVSAATELDYLDDSRAVAVVDWNFDGRLDFWITNRNAPRVRFLRNETENECSFVSFKLRGVTCNRDAIGARLQLLISNPNASDSPRTILKQLAAGDGYLSQSSKWVHFGIPNGWSIDTLKIQWPGTVEETIQGLQSGFHYELVEGSATARRWHPPGSPTNRIASDSVKNVANESVENLHRTVIVGKIPVPNAQFEDSQGNSISLSKFGGRPLLINLWSPTCVPCLQELAEWTRHHQRFDQSNVQLVALSVDGLLDSNESDVVDSKKALDDIGFAGISGIANPELVQLFEMLHDTYLQRRQDLPIPTSFLLDSAGQLSVIYKGPLPAETLLKDIELLDANPGERRASAVPFAGRWGAKPSTADPEAIVKQLEKMGRTEVAVEYARDCISRIEGEPFSTQQSTDHSNSERKKILIDLHGTLGELQLKLGRKHEAAESFARLLQLGDNRPNLHRDIGETYLANELPVQAVDHLEIAARANPDDGTLFYNLGISELASRRPDDAILHLRRAHELSPNDANVCFHLANALHGTAKTEEALAFYRKSLQLHPGWTLAQNNLAWILATHRDASIRDGNEAVRLAEAACEATKFSDPSALATLAAAYAEQGRFDDAIRSNKKALESAISRRLTSLATKLSERELILKAGKPVRD